MIINKEDFKLATSKIPELICYFFPGILCMDFIFHIGLFHNVVFSVFSFIIYVFLVIFISILFSTFIPINYSYSFRYAVIIESVQEDKIEKLSPEDEDELEDVSNYLNFIYIVISVVITILLFQYFNILYDINIYYNFFLSFVISKIFCYIVFRLISSPLESFFVYELKNVSRNIEAKFKKKE